MSPAETTGRFAKTDEGEDGEEESLVIDKTGPFVILGTGSLSELQTDIWGAEDWKEMYEVAVFTANKADTEAQGLMPKPLSAEAIIDMPPALAQPLEDGAVAINLAGDLEEGV